MADPSSPLARPPSLAQGTGPRQTSRASNSSPNHSSLRWPAVRVQRSRNRQSPPDRLLKTPWCVDLSALAMINSSRRPWFRNRRAVTPNLEMPRLVRVARPLLRRLTGPAHTQPLSQDIRLHLGRGLPESLPGLAAVPIPIFRFHYFLVPPNE